MTIKNLIVIPLLFLSVIGIAQTRFTNPHQEAMSQMDDGGKKAYVYEKIEQLGGKERHELLDVALPLAKEKDWKKESSNWTRWQGIQFYYDGDLAKALESYQQALSIAEDINDNLEKGLTYNEMCVLSSKQKDYKHAEKYIESAIKLCEAEKDSFCMARSYDNYGVLLLRMDNPNKAEQQFLQTLAIRKVIKDSIGLGYVYNNLAGIASSRGNHDEALELTAKSTKIRKLLGDSFNVAINICNMGELLVEAKRYEEAVPYFEESLSQAEVLGYTDFTQWVLDRASRNHAELGNMEKAHDYLRRSYELKDSILTVEKLAQITEMETKYDTAKKEEQIAKQQQRIQFTIGALIGLALVSLIGFLFFRTKQRAKLHEEQQKYQQQLLENTLITQENERKRIAKDLHDGVGQQLTGLKMAMQQLSGKVTQPTTSATLIKLTEILDDTTTDVRNLSHQMMPRTLQEYGLMTALEDMVEKSLGNSGLKYDFSSFKAEGRYDEKIEIGMYRVAQELINNLLKHAEAKEVSVQLLKNKTNLILTIEDDGKGFDVDKKIAGKGHGLMNIQSRVQAMSGTIHYESSKGKGTVATVRVGV